MSIQDDAIYIKAQAIRLPNSNANRPMRQNIITAADRIIAATVPTPAPTVTSIQISPASTTLETGQTKQFTVTASLSDGTTQQNPAGVNWSSDGGTLTTAGLWLAPAISGIYHIKATLNALSSTASCTVTAVPDTTVATVTIIVP